MSASTVGENIQTIRKMRQFSRIQLATMITVSESYLTKIELGYRVATPQVVLKVAQALRVGTDQLYGQPYYNSTETEEGVQGVIPDLRRVMLTYDSPEDLQAAPRPLNVLASEMEAVSRMRQDGQYVPMGPLLPPLLLELTHAALTSPAGEQQELAYWWLARGYRAANSLAHKLGHHDLSMTAIERVCWAASHSADPYMEVIGGYLRLGALMRQGLWQAAERLNTSLDHQVRQLADGRFDNTSRGLLGSFVLKRAAAAARQGNLEGTVRALEEAEEIAAASSNVDAVLYETSFGPSNIKIHEVHSFLDLGETEQAVRAAQGFTPPDDLPGERRSHHFIDLAAAQVATGDRGGALQSLQQARTIAPNHTRYHPTVRSTAATLVRLDRATQDSVAGFARWVAVK